MHKLTVKDLTHTHNRVQRHTSVLLQLMRRINSGCQPGYPVCMSVCKHTCDGSNQAPHWFIFPSVLCFISVVCYHITFFLFSFNRTSFWQMTYVSSWFVRQQSLMTSTPVGRSSWNDSTTTKMLSEEHTTQVIKGWCWTSPPSVVVDYLVVSVYYLPNNWQYNF